MVEHARWVASDAGLEVSDAALEQAITRGGGSARDTLSALELIASIGDGGLDIVAQSGMEQQVLGRIPADTQFREYDDIGAVAIARPLGILDDSGRIACHVPDDEVDLYAKYWPGGPVAVLAGHDFYMGADAAGGVDPQSSDSILWWTGVLANQGFTVLSPDYRGHGASAGSTSIKNAPLDLKAAYDFLVARGHETIVMAGMIGSGTAGVPPSRAGEPCASSTENRASLWPRRWRRCLSPPWSSPT